MRRHKHKPLELAECVVHIALDRRVLGYVASELAKSPHLEEGGKYIGYLVPPDSPRLQSLGLQPTVPALVVTDFLPSGPNAVRTAVELLPDGEYQEHLFRQVERMDPDVEHLGTWHSHHCNGLQTLSEGDIDGYFKTVNKRAYRPAYFLASLITRIPRHVDEGGWISHYLFVRGGNEYYNITESVAMVDWPSKFGALIDHESSAVVAKPHSDPKTRGVQAEDQTETPWYDSGEGRQTLAVDKKFFATHFRDGVVASRRGRSIRITGRLRETSISLTYPSDSANSSHVTVAVTRGAATILQIDAELKWRQLAVKAALGAAEELKSGSAGGPGNSGEDRDSPLI